MSLDHNMLPRALNNQSTLKKAYLQNTQQEGNMNYAYLTNWIAYLDKSISLIKFHVTDSQQFFSKIPKKTKTNWGSSQPPCIFYSYSSTKSVINAQVYLHTLHPYQPFWWRHTFTGLLANKEMTERKENSPNGIRKEPHPSTQLTRQRLGKTHLTPLLLFYIFQITSQVVPWKLKSLQAVAPVIDLKITPYYLPPSRRPCSYFPSSLSFLCWPKEIGFFKKSLKLVSSLAYKC